MAAAGFEEGDVVLCELPLCRVVANTTVGEGCGAPHAGSLAWSTPDRVYFNPSACEGGMTSREESTDPNRASGSHP